MHRRFILALVFIAVSVACFQPVTALEHTHDFVVGPQGGRFDIDGGLILVFPVNAVTEGVSVKVTRISPPPSYAPGEPLGDAWLIEPEGQLFNQLVQVSVPFGEIVPPGGRLRVARAPNKSRFFDLLFPVRTLDGLRVQTSHFSIFVPVAVFDDGGTGDVDAGELDAGIGKHDAG